MTGLGELLRGRAAARQHFQTVRLRCHPATPCAAVRSITVRIAETADGSLQLNYSLKANLSQLRIPPARPAARVDGLWQHSCFEVFARRAGEKGYVEFNFSSSGEWAAYGFRVYREPRPLMDNLSPPGIQVRQTSGRLELQVTFDPKSLLAPNGPLQLGIAAVIEATDGALSYWALQHPAEKPDFHHPDSFAFSLDAGSSVKT